VVSISASTGIFEITGTVPVEQLLTIGLLYPSMTASQRAEISTS